MKRLLTYSLFLFLLVFTAKAQQIPEKGVPHLENYTPFQYNNQGKVWDIDSAPNGIVYMAADRGLLEFDGQIWKNFSGSDGFTRSVHVVNDSLIYTGSDLDFGVWERNRYLEFEYRSLYPFREDLLDISEEFWDIRQVGEDILFISDYNIYLFRNGNLTKISAPNQFNGSFKVNGDLYLSDEEAGLLMFNDLSFDPVIEFPENSEIEISGVYHHNEDIVLVSYNSGLFRLNSGELIPIDSPISQTIKNTNVFSFEQIDENYLAFGTVQKGLYISDINGNIIHYINRNKGLTNNTILSLHYSQNNQLWLGLDFGVSSLGLRNQMTFFYDFRGDFGTGYTAQLKNDVFYLGTNKGLFSSSWEELNNDVDFYRFDIIPESKGQVWMLKEIENELFVGHDRGLFILNEGRLDRVGSQEGFWTVATYKDYLLGGTYNGIAIFQKVDNEWTYLKTMDLIRGSANQIIVDSENTLWVNIPTFGIIRTELDDDLIPVDREIFSNDTFKGSDPFIVNDRDSIRVRTDEFEYTYSVADSTFSSRTEINYRPLTEDMMPWIYRSTMLNENIQFLPLYNGFAFNFLEDNYFNGTGNTNLIFRSIEAYNNEEKVQAFAEEKIPHNYNNVRVEFLVPNRKNVLYQHRLNSDNNWSSWTYESGVDLINLSNGNYDLSVRAKIDQTVYETSTISFQIATPWYLSWYAYAAYLVLITAFVYLLYLWQKQIFKKQEKQFLVSKQQSLREQAEKHRQKILRIEQERLQEDFNQLKKELKDKTIELANKAKESEDKNRLIEKLKKKFKKIEESSDIPKSRWKEIHSLLNSYSTEDDNTFEIQMDQLHQEFFQRLKNEYSQLSSNDLRLCAYLKLGFNSKEIADFMNIQPSSVYINRSRLRKKLDLNTEQDLHEFLNSV